MSFQSGHMHHSGRELGNMLAIMNKQQLSYIIIRILVKFMKKMGNLYSKPEQVLSEFLKSLWTHTFSLVGHVNFANTYLPLYLFSPFCADVPLSNHSFIHCISFQLSTRSLPSQNDLQGGSAPDEPHLGINAAHQ